LLPRRELLIKLVKELLKHAQRDKCYDCRKILEELGLNPDKSYDEIIHPRED